jgi:predicted nucleic acid-binding protein
LDLLNRAWKLRDNISAYDAMYVALAEAMTAPIVARDVRLRTLADTAPGSK